MITKQQARSIIRKGVKRVPSGEEIRSAALQFVRKVSGYRSPSRRNAEAFDAAVTDIALASRRLLDAITVER